jgi:hypothetical protein
MDMSNKLYGGAPFKVFDLAAMGASAELLALKIDIENKPLKAEAPTDGMYSGWTLEAKSRLDSFLSDVFGWK